MELKAGYKNTEVGVIPEGWEVKRLGDIADTDSENLSSSTNPNYTFNYIALEDVNHGNLNGYSEVTYLAAPSRARRRLRDGDILMATVRPNLKAHLLFKGYTGEWVCSTGFCVIRNRGGVSDSGYLMQHLFAHPINKQIEALIAGSNYPAINNKDVRSLEVPVPPCDEQTAIATALSDVDSLLDGLDRLIAKKRDIKQAAMQQLLTGETRLPGFGGDWVERKLVELADFYDNLRIPVTESKREIGITPYYGANGIQGYIKGHTHDGEFVLFAEDGANDLNNYPVFYVNGKIWVNNHAHVIQGIPGKAKTKYLAYALKNLDFVQVLVGGTRAKLNGCEAKAIKSIIPFDIDEQTAIATVLSDMDAEITALEQRRNKTKDLKQAMMQELLTGKTRLVTPGGPHA